MDASRLAGARDRPHVVPPRGERDVAKYAGARIFLYLVKSVNAPRRGFLFLKTARDISYPKSDLRYRDLLNPAQRPMADNIKPTMTRAVRALVFSSPLHHFALDIISAAARDPRVRFFALINARDARAKRSELIPFATRDHLAVNKARPNARTSK